MFLFFRALQLRECFILVERSICKKPLILIPVNVYAIGYLMNSINPVSPFQFLLHFFFRVPGLLPRKLSALELWNFAIYPKFIIKKTKKTKTV